MKNIKQIVSFVALLCFNQPVIKTSDSLSPVVDETVVVSYHHDQHKDAVLKLLQESSYELGYDESSEIQALEGLANSFEYKQVLINSGKVIGFSMFAQLYGEGHIRCLVIAKQFRNMGFGKILLDSAIQKLKEEGVQYIIASVYEDRVDGGKFWIKQGFEILKDPATGKIVSILDRDRKLSGYVLKI